MNSPLPFQQFQYDMARHIRAPRVSPRPKGVSPRRMKVYNELFFNNVSGFIDACFPVAHGVLGERRWRRLCRQFFAQWRSHTPYFREIPREFLRWVMEDGLADKVPPYFTELLHYEWAELAVDVMEVELPPAVDGDLIENCPVLNPALLNLAYQWPVHCIGPAYRPRKPRPAQLLVFRKRDDSVAFIEINPVASRLLTLLTQAETTGRTALTTIAGELGHADPQAVVAHGAAMLRDLLREEVLLGVTP